MENTFDREKSLAEAMKELHEKVKALSDLLGGDVELFSSVADKLDYVLMAYLDEKDVYIVHYDIFDYLNGEKTFEDLVKDGKEMAEKITSGEMTFDELVTKFL